ARARGALSLSAPSSSSSPPPPFGGGGGGGGGVLSASLLLVEAPLTPTLSPRRAGRGSAGAVPSTHHDERQQHMTDETTSADLGGQSDIIARSAGGEGPLSAREAAAALADTRPKDAARPRDDAP